MPSQTKYKQYYQEMTEENATVFAAFKRVHDLYKQDRKTWSQQFHEQGKVVVEIMRDWERRLCSGMERGKHSQYSSKLAEKFWAEIKKEYSHIELVGVKSNLD